MILQLGLGFCPSEPINTFKTIKDLYLFTQNVTFIFIFDKDRKKLNLEKELTKRTKHFSMQAFRALGNLMLLYEEGDTDNDSLVVSESFSSLVPLNYCPAVWAFLRKTIKRLKKQPWPDLLPNLTKKQTRIWLSSMKCFYPIPSCLYIVHCILSLCNKILSYVYIYCLFMTGLI